MGEVVFLVRSAVSEDTVAALTHLLQEALAGEVVGIACVVIHPGRHFSIDLAGAAKTEPLLTRGMVCMLDEKVAELGKPE